jgi:hypothetical protein
MYYSEEDNDEGYWENGEFVNDEFINDGLINGGLINDEFMFDTEVQLPASPDLSTSPESIQSSEASYEIR